MATVTTLQEPAITKKTDYTRGVSCVYTAWIGDDEVKNKFNEISIVSLCIYKSKINIDLLKTRLREKVLPRAARMRSVAVRDERNRMAFRELAIEEVDLDSHVKELPSEKPWTQGDVDKYLSEFWHTFNDPGCPLWSFKVIQNLADGRSALIFCVDHAVGDGISMVWINHEICDAAETPPRSVVPHKRKAPLWPTVKAFVRGTYLTLIGHLLPADPPNKLKLEDIYNPSPDCKFGCSESVSLQKIKAIKNRLKGTSVNDVLSAVLNLAVQRYLASKGDPIAAPNSTSSIRANFPINLRSAKETAAGLDGNTFGNAWSTGTLSMPMKRFAKREEAVWRMMLQMDMIKLSPQPFIEAAIVKLLVAILPAQQMINFAIQLTSKFTVLMSNVPGPPSALYLDGVELEKAQYWLFSPIGLYCGMMSYNDEVSFTIACDPKVIENPSELTSLWNEEMEELYKEVMEGPVREGPPANLRPGLLCVENALMAVMAAGLAVMCQRLWLMFA